MSAESAVYAGRAAAQGLMSDTCIITRVDPDAPEPDPDPDTLVIPPKAHITIYSGMCQFQTPGVLASDSSTDADERSSLVQATIVKLPFTDAAGDVAPNDVVEIVACPTNPSLVGRKPTIRGKEPLKTNATARRFILNEVAR